MAAENLIIPYLSLIKKFNRNEYAAAFAGYSAQTASLLAQIDEEWRKYAAPAGEAYLSDEAGRLVAAVKTVSDGARSRRAVVLKADDYRLVLLFYTLPMLGAAEHAAAKPLAEQIIHAWNAAGFRGPLQMTEHQALLNGFPKGIFSMFTR